MGEASSKKWWLREFKRGPDLSDTARAQVEGLGIFHAYALLRWLNRARDGKEAARLRKDPSNPGWWLVDYFTLTVQFRERTPEELSDSNRSAAWTVWYVNLILPRAQLAAELDALLPPDE